MGARTQAMTTTVAAAPAWMAAEDGAGRTTATGRREGWLAAPTKTATLETAVWVGVPAESGAEKAEAGARALAH